MNPTGDRTDLEWLREDPEEYKVIEIVKQVCMKCIVPRKRQSHNNPKTHTRKSHDYHSILRNQPNGPEFSLCSPPDLRSPLSASHYSAAPSESALRNSTKKNI